MNCVKGRTRSQFRGCEAAVIVLPHLFPALQTCLIGEIDEEEAQGEGGVPDTDLLEILLQ